MSMFHTLLVTGLLLLLSFGNAVYAGDDLQLVKATIDTGGTESAGGSLVLRASIGQPDAGQSRGAGYQLEAGFWSTTVVDFMFADSFEEN